MTGKKTYDYELMKNEYIQKYFDKLSAINEPIALVLTIHLYTEFWINKLIEYFSPQSKEILGNKNFTFSIKLILVYNMGLIPETLYINIKKLNKLRNEFAHNLEFDFKKSDLNYITQYGENIQKYVNSESEWRIFMYIGTTTFEWLATDVIMKICEKPEGDKENED